MTLLGVLFLFTGNEMFAHPGSGIFVDRQGTIYFVDTGAGIWKLERSGTLTKLTAPAYHWMAFDVYNKRANTSSSRFALGNGTIIRDSGEPRIFVSSDFPITIGSNGDFYYPAIGSTGQLQINRLDTSGHNTVVKNLPEHTESGPLRWLNGIVVSADGSIYYSEDKAIRRITPEGELATLFLHPTTPRCDSVPGVESEQGPYLRGIDVDKQGNVYAAVTGCGSVVKITPQKEAKTILRTQSPWSPTAVAVSGDTVYVLEYLHTASHNRQEWLPRIRKVSSDGQVVTLTSVERR